MRQECIGSLIKDEAFNKKWGKVNENVADCTMVLAKVTETLGWPTSSFLMSSKILGVTFGKKHISGVLLSLLNFSLKSVNSDLLSHKIYVSTTLLRQWGFRHWLPFSWTTLRGKHCRHPIHCCNESCRYVWAKAVVRKFLKYVPPSIRS